MQKPKFDIRSVFVLSSYYLLSSLMFYLQEACIEKIVRFISGDDRTDRWVASIGGSQYSYARQNTYQRTISQDSNANSTRSESDTFINGQKDTQ